MNRLVKRWYRLITLFIAGLIFGWVVNGYNSWWQSSSVAAQSLPSSQLEQQGIKLYQDGKYNDAIAVLQQALGQTQVPQERAVILINLGEAYRQIGKFDLAIAHWQQAIDIYQSRDDKESRHQLTQLLTQQAQAYINIGQTTRAIELLQNVIKITEAHPDPIVKMIAQGVLGNAYRSVGDDTQAETAHKASLEISQSLKNPEYITTAWNNLGNVYLSLVERSEYQLQSAYSERDKSEEEILKKKEKKDLDAALNAYEQSLEASKSIGGLSQVRALLNLTRSLEKLPTYPKERIDSNRSQVRTLLAAQPDSREKAYALVNLGEDIRSEIAQEQSSTSNPQTKDSALKAYSTAEEVLENALTGAQKSGDSRAESFAIGTLGTVYESAKEYPKAMQYTRQAELAAQKVNAADSLYRWQWQIGRILNATGEKQQAIASYEQAIATLQSIRSDIVAASKELQFNFRDSVEPVYRQLIGLLLEKSPTANSQLKAEPSDVSSKTITKALDTLELLKLAELQNYFGDECVQVAQANAKVNAAPAATNTAIIYSVILDDRTAMIVQLPNKPVTVYPIAIGAKELQQEIDNLRLLLENQTTEDYLPQSQKVYELLFRPIEADIAAAKPNTLVFIQDGVLRKVPMSALYDGKQFLIEKYPIATTPSLNLTNRGLQNRQEFKALIVGLSVAHPPFAAIPNVKKEVAGVKKIMGGTELVDKEFTLANLEQQLTKENYPIIHMATHGKFGVDAENTFLVTFDQKLHINELDIALRSRQSQQPVELLTLSACQTAAGDNRSALGIAGVAVRAGVQSALASLWYINDAATVPLIEEFYRQLRQPNVTKAEALRMAQLKLINDPQNNHPALWSPFILIGNWL